MSRRRTDLEQEFGSDSFLDIIANIVGILIILIVVAGIKVARQPLESADVDTAPMKEEISSAADVELPAVADPAVRPNQQLEPAADAATTNEVALNDGDGLPADVAAAIESLTEPEQHSAKLTPDLSPEAQQKLDAEISALTLQLEELQTTTAASETERDALQQKLTATNDTAASTELLRGDVQQKSDRLEAIETEIAHTKTQLTSYRGAIQTLAERQKYVADALQQVGLETRRLNEVIEDAQPDEESADTIQHRLAPVGRSVTEEELHFRVSGGRVAHIPLDGLLQRMKEQVADRRHIVMRYQRYEGVAGPVGGFRMKYTVQREMMAPLQALQYGRNAFRLSVARWSIHPADTLRAESVAEAVQLGSRFRQIVESAEQDTTVTIWVYGDDFEHFGALRQLIHRLNLRVAARPLPDGTPIAGSPSGSRSSSQ